MYLYVYIYINIYVYVCKYICIYIYIYIGDTGSASVQIAVMTEKIKNLARHFTVHKKDKHGGRGFQVREYIIFFICICIFFIYICIYICIISTYIYI
jgi:hypothetical protein